MVAIIIAAAGLVGLVVPEFGLALLIYSGNYEPVTFYGIKVVYPVFLCAGLGFAWLAFRRRLSSGARQYSHFLPSILLPGLLLLSVLWSRDAEGGLPKALKVAAAVALGVLAAVVLAGDRDRLKRFVVYTIAIGTLICAAGLIRSFAAGSWGRGAATSTGEAYILYGRAAGVLLVASLAMMLESPSLRVRVLLFVPVVLAVMGLLESTSRGQMASAALVVALLIMPALLVKRCRGAAALGGLAVTCGILLYFASHAWCGGGPYGGGQLAIARIEAIPYDPSYLNRLHFYYAALLVFREHPIVGVGSEGYPALTGINYPHNLILEIAAELGLLGLAALVFWVVCSGRAVARAWPGGAEQRAPAAVAVVAAMLLVWFLSAQFSFNVNGNRIIFLLAPVLSLSLAGLMQGRSPSESRASAATGSVSADHINCTLCENAGGRLLS